MAALDKSSVREEVGHLKAQFEALSAQGKLSGESKVLFTSLLLIVELILSIFLERQTPKTSRNSSLPSSQSEDDQSALSPAGSHGKGKRLHDAGGTQRSVRETVTLSTVERCPVCGQALDKVPCTHHERRTRIDIVFEKVVEHVDAEIKCGQFPHFSPLCKQMDSSPKHG